MKNLTILSPTKIENECLLIEKALMIENYHDPHPAKFREGRTLFTSLPTMAPGTQQVLSKYCWMNDPWQTLPNSRKKRGNEQEFEARTVFNAFCDHCYLHMKSIKYIYVYLYIYKTTIIYRHIYIIHIYVYIDVYIYIWVLKIRFHVEFAEISNVKRNMFPCVNEFDIMKRVKGRNAYIQNISHFTWSE